MIVRKEGGPTGASDTSTAIRFKCSVQFGRGPRGRQQMCAGQPPGQTAEGLIRAPRISHVMALAIRFESLMRTGEVDSYADLARLTGVSRPRITQIMGLLRLAPDIQEALLFLPETSGRRESVQERDVRRIAAEVDWAKQRRMWGEIAGSTV